MKFEFRVAAENRAGQGPFSESTSPIVAKEPLGKLNFENHLTDNLNFENQ